MNLPSDLKPVYLADYEGYEDGPVIVKIEITEVLDYPEGEDLTEYLGTLLSDAFGSAGFNIVVANTAEAAQESRGVH